MFSTKQAFIMKYFTVGLLSLLFAAGVVIWWQHHNIVSQEATIATYEANKNTYEASIASLNKKIEADKVLKVEEQKLREQTAADLQEANIKNAKLQQQVSLYYGRQDIVFKKPGLVELKEQKKFEEFRSNVNEP